MGAVFNLGIQSFCFRKFLPIPVVAFNGNKYYLNYDLPHSIGKIRGFYGNVSNAVRTFAWVMTMGAEGLKEAGEIATLNANYLTKKLVEIPGIRALMGENPYRPRLGQAEFNLDKIKEDTGIGLSELNMRIIDHGYMTCETGHHPYLGTNNPMALEPTESLSKTDLDEYISVWKKIVDEAYNNPEILRTAPHNTQISKIDMDAVNNPSKWATTWRAYKKKRALPKNP